LCGEVFKTYSCVVEPARNFMERCSFVMCEKAERWMSITHIKVKVKSKGIPLQAWTGPKSSRRLRLPDFKTICTCGW